MTKYALEGTGKTRTAALDDLIDQSLSKKGGLVLSRDTAAMIGSEYQVSVRKQWRGYARGERGPTLDEAYQSAVEKAGIKPGQIQGIRIKAWYDTERGAKPVAEQVPFEPAGVGTPSGAAPAERYRVGSDDTTLY